MPPSARSSSPGCDGIVARRYVKTSPDGPVGVCGIAAAHVRLAETDPFARAELARLGSPRISPLAYGSDTDDLDELPFETALDRTPSPTLPPTEVPHPRR